MISQDLPPIPFNRPSVSGREMEYIAEALRQGKMAGDGAFTERCSRWIEEIHGAKRALLTTSCTHALELAALLLDIRAGDEVVVPSFTFVSTANAFALRGARIVFADVRPDTLNLDEAALPGLITSRTKVIVPMHYAGVACEMDAILACAEAGGCAVVEDNAQGLFGRYRDRPLGSLGRFSTLSFHETKNLICGEGGALVINREQDVERAEILREKGTDRARFFRGEVDKYSWRDIGSSFLPSEILAAFLWAQMEASERIQSDRRRRWTRYDQALGDWAVKAGAQTPVVPPHCTQAFHMYYLLMPSPSERTRLIGHLGARGVGAVFHYVPLDTSQVGRAFGAVQGACPVSQSVSERLVRLPFSNDLTPSEQERVIDAVLAYSA